MHSGSVRGSHAREIRIREESKAAILENHTVGSRKVKNGFENGFEKGIQFKEKSSPLSSSPEQSVHGMHGSDLVYIYIYIYIWLTWLTCLAEICY